MTEYDLFEHRSMSLKWFLLLLPLVKYWLKLLACSTASVCNGDPPFHQYDTSDETDIADEPPTKHASHQTVTELFNSACP